MEQHSTGQANQDRADAARAAIVRALPALLLAWAGIVLTIYGATSHAQPVLVERELDLPPRLGPGPFPGELPEFAGPPVTEIVETSESEPGLIREVTVGGVTRLETGEIQRTYSGDAPSLCPT
ncbi:MAG: hypothetical protein ACYS8L_09695 [Planctomycetota bacterium]